MAMTSADCEAMIRAGEQAKKKLMIAYRLHHEEGNLRAMELARSGQLGPLRYFSACFSQEVREGDIRTHGDVGGGALYDLGTYCVNAARYLFRDEPVRVFGAQLGRGDDPRFQDVDETTSALLEFPDGRLAQLTCSQGAADVSHYRLVGTEGDLLMEPAFGYATELELRVTTNGETRSTKFPKRDQFAAEFEAFSRCILEDRDPEPSGREGLADVRVLEAVIASARSGRAVTLEPFDRTRRPDMSQEIRKPPVDEKPETIHAPSPSR
jgi:predicted dehydrogenase